MPSKNHRSLLYASLATLFWATAASAFKIGLAHFNDNVASLLLWSVFFSFISLLLIRLFLNQSSPPSREGWKRSLLTGFLNPALYYLILLEAYSRLPGSEAQPLNFTWPIVLTILSIVILKQPFRWIQILSIILGFSGVLVISTHGDFRNMHFSDPLGVSLAVGSSLLWAGYWIINMKDTRDAVTKMIWNFTFGFIYLIVYCGIRGRILIPNCQGILAAAWIGFFEMGITFYLWMRAMELASSTSHISQLVYLCPFLSLIFLELVIHEQIAPSSVWGLILILAGVIITQLAQNRRITTNSQI